MMEDAMFNDLLASVGEAKEILQYKKQPSRSFISNKTHFHYLCMYFTANLCCVAGERAAPPEDCGGVGGYYGLLEVLADPTHEVHRDLLRWLKGTRPRKGSYEPEIFEP